MRRVHYCAAPPAGLYMHRHSIPALAHVLMAAAVAGIAAANNQCVPSITTPVVAVKFALMV